MRRTRVISRQTAIPAEDPTLGRTVLYLARYTIVELMPDKRTGDHEGLLLMQIQAGGCTAGSMRSLNRSSISLTSFPQRRDPTLQTGPIAHSVGKVLHPHMKGDFLFRKGSGVTLQAGAIASSVW